MTDVTAASCRICGKGMVVPISSSETMLSRGRALLGEHVRKYHTPDQIIRVYVLHEPWWTVHSPESTASVDRERISE